MLSIYILLLVAHYSAHHRVLREDVIEAVFLYAGRIVQIVCGALLLVQALRLRNIGLLHDRSAPDFYEDFSAPNVHTPGQRIEIPVARHCTVPTTRPAATFPRGWSRSDLENSTAGNFHRQGIIDSRTEFERSPAHLQAIVAMTVLCALLTVVTGLPQAMGAPVVAMALYSTGARACEIVLVVLLVERSHCLQVHLRSQQEQEEVEMDINLIDESSLRDAADLPVNAYAPAPVVHKPADPSVPSVAPLDPTPSGRPRSVPAVPSPDCSVNNRRSSRVNSDLVRASVAQLPGFHNSSITSNNKKWPWVFTPDNGTDNLDVLYAVNAIPSYNVDSGSEDSTDSSGTYFTHYM